VLTEIPRGVESDRHVHPGEEVGYIAAGTVEMRIGGRPTLTLHAGDGCPVPPRTAHNAIDIGLGTGESGFQVAPSAIGGIGVDVPSPERQAS
jgi:quercetin dioxygenase-like cupin family protein